MDIRVVIEVPELVQVLHRMCSLLENRRAAEAEKPAQTQTGGVPPKTRTEPLKPQTEPIVEEKEEEKPTVSAYDAAEVRAALGSLGKTHGKETAKKLLSDFGATKFSDLAPEQYPGLMEAIGGYF